MKIIITTKDTNQFIAQNDNVQSLTHDKDTDILKVNDISLKHASDYNIIVSM